MKNLRQHLDQAKAITGSDYKTAIELGKSRQYISMARKGKGFSNECCRKLAEITGENPLKIIASVEVGAHPEREKMWTKWIAATVIMSVLVLGNSTYISKSYADSIDSPFYTLYAILIACHFVSLAVFFTFEKLCKNGNQLRYNLRGTY